MRFQIVLLVGFLFCHTCKLPLFAENEPHKNGRFKVTFSERSPLSSFQEMKKRKVSNINQPGDLIDAKDDYKIEDITYEVLVPTDYDQSKPMGLFVWINSGPNGSPPKQFLGPLAKHGFIFIGANETGNSDPLLRRLGAAIDAVPNMQTLYNIDKDRVYISGNSGGGRCASYASVIFPDVFTGGAFYVIGCNFWDTIPVPGKPGYTYPGFWPGKDSRLIRQAKDHYFVFLTGSKDFNQPGTIGAYQAYKKDGFKYCKYIEVPDMEHTTPPGEYFEQGLIFLNDSLKEKGKAALQEGIKKLKSKNYNDAIPLFEQARNYGIEEAQLQIDTVTAQIDADTAKGLKFLEEKNPGKARVVFQNIIRIYGENNTAMAQEELHKIENDPIIVNEIKATEIFQKIRNNYKTTGKIQTTIFLKKLIDDYPDTAAAERARTTLKNMEMQ